MTEGRLERILVHPIGRFLMTQSEKPFFWLADTAWELFHRLNDEEAKNYLANRAEKGFTVIQAVALAEDNGLNAPKPSGDLPLIDLDPSQPNEGYFSQVDRMISRPRKKSVCTWRYCPPGGIRLRMECGAPGRFQNKYFLAGV